MADLVQATALARRAADALLRGAGGRSVLLRMPSPATPGDVTEQLGLATPSFQDVTLAPVVLRRAGTSWELLVSGSAVESVMGTLANSSASVLFADAFGVLVDGVLMEIASATESELFGVPYLYRLALRAPISQTI